jgi:hypothetical protein
MSDKCSFKQCNLSDHLPLTHCIPTSFKPASKYLYSESKSEMPGLPDGKTNVQECKLPDSDLELPFECPTDFFIHPELLDELPIRLPGHLSRLQARPFHSSSFPIAG